MQTSFTLYQLDIVVSSISIIIHFTLFQIRYGTLEMKDPNDLNSLVQVYANDTLYFLQENPLAIS